MKKQQRLSIIKNLFLAIALMSLNNTNAQWTFYKNRTMTSKPIEITSNADDYLYLLHGGYLYLKKPNYNQWETVIDPLYENRQVGQYLLKTPFNVNAVFTDGISGISVTKLYNVNDYNNVGFVQTEKFHVGSTTGHGQTAYDILFDGNSRYIFFSSLFSTSVFVNTYFGLNGNWATWENVIVPFTFSCSEIISPNNYLLSTENAFGINSLLSKSTDGGLTWTTISSFDSSTITSIKKAFGSSIYAIEKSESEEGNIPDVYSLKKSTDNGNTWTVVVSNIPQQQLYELYFHTESQTLYLCGEQGLYSLSSENSSWINETYNLDNTQIKKITRISNKLYCITGVGEEDINVYKRGLPDTIWTEDNLNLVHDQPSEFSFNADNKIVLEKPIRDYQSNKYIKENGIGWERKSIANFNQYSGNIPELLSVKVIPASNSLYVTKNTRNSDNEWEYKLYRTNDQGNTSQLLNAQDYNKTYSFNSTGKVTYWGKEQKKKLYLYNESNDSSTIIYEIPQGDTFQRSQPVITENGKIYVNEFASFSSDYTRHRIIDPEGNVTIFNSTGKFRPKTKDQNIIYGYAPIVGTNYIALQKLDLTTNSIATLSYFPSSITLDTPILAKGNTIYIFSDGIKKSTDGGLTWVNLPAVPTAGDSLPRVSYSIDNDGKLFAEAFSFSNSSADGFYYFADALSNEEFNSDIFTLYPNPTKDVFNVSGISPIKSISIFNMLGQKIFTVDVNFQNSYQMDISKLAQATYLVKIENEHASKTMKIIKN